MRVLLILLCGLLFFGGVHALEVSRLNIDIEVFEDGYARIFEKYSIRFFAGELPGFREDVRDNSSSLSAWQVDYNWFFPHFGGDALESSYITFDEGEQSLTLEYFLRVPFATKVREEARQTLWLIADRQLSYFQSAGNIVIPEDVSITIDLPNGAEIDLGKLTPRAEVSGTSVRLNGISSNYIKLEYGIPKPIAPLMNPFTLLQTNIVWIMAIVLVVGGAIYIGRREITEKVEGFVLAHSKIEPVEPEEEVELQLD